MHCGVDVMMNAGCYIFFGIGIFIVFIFVVWAIVLNIKENIKNKSPFTIDWKYQIKQLSYWLLILSIFVGLIMGFGWVACHTGIAQWMLDNKIIKL